MFSIKYRSVVARGEEIWLVCVGVVVDMIDAFRLVPVAYFFSSQGDGCLEYLGLCCGVVQLTPQV